MAFLDKAQVEKVKQGIAAIVSQVETQARKNDAEDIAEYVGSEIVTLVEYMTEDPALQGPVAAGVLAAKK